jgi:DNA-binding NarL/FixJ family response regulator
MIITAKILVADDHPVVYQSLHMFLTLAPEIEVVGLKWWERRNP